MDLMRQIAAAVREALEILKGKARRSQLNETAAGAGSKPQASDKDIDRN